MYLLTLFVYKTPKKKISYKKINNANLIKGSKKAKKMPFLHT